MYWNRKARNSHGMLWLFVDSGPRIGWEAPAEGLPAIYLKVWADAEHFALDQIEALVKQMEAVVVAAAFDARAVAAG
jgi:hypothetical protein